VQKPVRTRASNRGTGSELARGARFTGEFHMGRSSVHRALRRLVERLEAAEIPYAVVGAMALNAYGYRRATVDVDVLVTAEGLERFRALWLGHGYAEQFAGSRGVKDTQEGVPIDFLVAGDHPGDGLPGDVVFPDPTHVVERRAEGALLPLERFVEMKLASGLRAPHRLRDVMFRPTSFELEAECRLAGGHGPGGRMRPRCRPPSPLETCGTRH
jgi:hypothetical protein